MVKAPINSPLPVRHMSTIFKIQQQNQRLKKSQTERYTIIEQIGRGAFGSVFSAIDTDTFQRVAIKISDEPTSSRREVSFLNKCKGNPNIIQMYDSYYHQNNYYLVLELGEMSLREYLRHRTCTYTTARSIIRQICYGMSFIHSLGFIHSDLKPDNIMITHKNSEVVHVKIIDFGCVRKISQIPLLYPGETDDSMIYFTTRWFRSPEVILNHIQHVNHGVDLWAVGCIMYQIISRRYLFCGMNHEDMLSWFELHLGRIPSDVLQRNTLTYDSYFTKPDEFDEYECGESFVQKVREHYEESQIQQRLESTNMYIQEERISEEQFERQLKTRHIKQCIFSVYHTMINPRIYLEDIIKDQMYCNVMKLLLQYDPLKRPDAVCIAELLDY